MKALHQFSVGETVSLLLAVDFYPEDAKILSIEEKYNNWLGMFCDHVLLECGNGVDKEIYQFQLTGDEFLDQVRRAEEWKKTTEISNNE